jgi:hypothetical protein
MIWPREPRCEMAESREPSVVCCVCFFCFCLALCTYADTDYRHTRTAAYLHMHTCTLMLLTHNTPHGMSVPGATHARANAHEATVCQCLARHMRAPTPTKPVEMSRLLVFAFAFTATLKDCRDIDNEPRKTTLSSRNFDRSVVRCMVWVRA